ncbi:MAG: TIGR02996 domain-containing protein [Planctomycetia bacterium]|nr:TIGR02996 domain-containing protein [Planctomycetia bacterium]
MDLLLAHETHLQAIFDLPDDDQPRLAYADFLEANGNPDRAQLIRVECELAAIVNQPQQSERYHHLRIEERQLIDRLYPGRQQWQPHERERIDHVRGFLFAAKTMIVTSAILEKSIPARWEIVQNQPEAFGAVNLALEPGLMLMPEHIERLFSLPAVGRIAEWDLCGCVEEFSEGVVRTDPGSIMPAITLLGIETLARHEGARIITALDLRNNNLDNDAGRALAHSPHLINIQRLQLREGNRISGRIWQEVVEKFGKDVVS